MVKLMHSQLDCEEFSLWFYLLSRENGYAHPILKL